MNYTVLNHRLTASCGLLDMYSDYIYKPRSNHGCIRRTGGTLFVSMEAAQWYMTPKRKGLKLSIIGPIEQAHERLPLAEPATSGLANLNGDKVI